jgi:hypothetical protein
MRWLYSGSTMVELCAVNHPEIMGLNPTPATDREEMQKMQSAANLCCQVAAWVPDMLFNSYLVKNHKFAYSSTNIKAKEKIRADLEY